LGGQHLTTPYGSDKQRHRWHASCPAWQLLTSDAAERAWSIYQSRHSQLDGRDLVITQAEVDGKTYYRVAATGFSARGAASMCATLKAGGAGCIAHAESSPLPGAIDRGVRLSLR